MRIVLLRDRASGVCQACEPTRLRTHCKAAATVCKLCHLENRGQHDDHSDQQHASNQPCERSAHCHCCDTHQCERHVRVPIARAGSFTVVMVLVPALPVKWLRGPYSYSNRCCRLSGTRCTIVPSDCSWPVSASLSAAALQLAAGRPSHGVRPSYGCSKCRQHNFATAGTAARL